MEHAPVRIVFATTFSDNLRERITTSLEHEGIVADQRSAFIREHATILFYDVVDAALFELVRAESRLGLHRLLAIATETRALEAHSNSWSLLECGAADVLFWDDDSGAASVVRARLDRWRIVDEIVESPLVRNNLVGRSNAWVSVLRQLVEVAHFTDASLLLTGESGTGKELMARLVHTLDRREPKRDLIVVDCTTVVTELAGSEFFGHERGAFTNAVATRSGAFALADRGTLFLDEVGELPLTLQAELLRAVQERSFKRVGSNEWQHVNLRLICATNRDLIAEEARGNFRRDFYYRIASWVCHLPTLRERSEDILLLAEHFLQKSSHAGSTLRIDEPVREYLMMRDYPGNVRDLQQLVARILCRHVGPGPITVGDIPADDRPEATGVSKTWRDDFFKSSLSRALALGIGLKEIGRGATETAIDIALDDEEGNIQRAARKLGVTDRALQMRRAETGR